MIDTREVLNLALSGGAGGLLGAIFFGGLWWTVQKGSVSAVPALWFLGSLLLRMGIVLTGFYLVADGRWERLTLCLVGFLLARLAVTRITLRFVVPHTLDRLSCAPEGPSPIGSGAMTAEMTAEMTEEGLHAP